MNVRRALRRIYYVLRPPGAVGLGLLVVALAVFGAKYIPARATVAALQTKMDSQPRSAIATTATTEAGLSDFYAFFPTLVVIPESLARVYALADKEGLAISKANYRLIEHPRVAMASYEAIFPVGGTYLQVRRFVAAILREFPYAALDDLKLERQRAEDPFVESQIKLTFYLRMK